MTSFIFPILQDISAVVGIPTATIAAFFENRKKILQEAILCEIRQGDLSKIHNDDKIAIAYKLLQSAMEGIAKNNLRLMCQVINGLEEKNSLTATSFLKYAQILATLSEDEIIVLGIMAKYYPPSVSDGRFINDRDREIIQKMGNKSEAIQSALCRTGLVKLIIKSEGTPKHKILNTGRPDWVDTPAQEYEIKTNNTYHLTPLMEEIMEYTQFLLKE